MAATTAKRKVDVQSLIEDWALDYFRRKASRKERRLLDQDFVRHEVCSLHCRGLCSWMLSVTNVR